MSIKELISPVSEKSVAMQSPFNLSEIHEAAYDGRFLKHSEAEELEQSLVKNQVDLRSRCMLLSYYVQHEPNQPGFRADIERHILWIIKNCPEHELAGIPEVTIMIDPAICEIAYGIARSIWLTHIRRDPENLLLLKNAGKFFFFADREFAVELHARAAKLDSRNGYWFSQLASLHDLQAGSALRMAETLYGPDRDEQLRIARESSLRAFQEQNKAFELATTPADRWLTLTDLAVYALSSGQLETAHALALQLLAPPTDSLIALDVSVPTYIAHVILSRKLIATNDVQGAKKHLELAYQESPDSALVYRLWLEQIVPLLQELATVGELESVLDFYDFCCKNPDNKYLRWWNEAVAQGNLTNLASDIGTSTS